MVQSKKINPETLKYLSKADVDNTALTGEEALNEATKKRAVSTPNFLNDGDEFYLEGRKAFGMTTFNGRQVFYFVVYVPNRNVSVPVYMAQLHRSYRICTKAGEPIKENGFQKFERATGDFADIYDSADSEKTAYLKILEETNSMEDAEGNLPENRKLVRVSVKTLGYVLQRDWSSDDRNATVIDTDKQLLSFTIIKDGEYTNYEEVPAEKPAEVPTPTTEEVKPEEVSTSISDEVQPEEVKSEEVQSEEVKEEEVKPGKKGNKH